VGNAENQAHPDPKEHQANQPTPQP
jgi:hypothetical protein